MVPPPQTPPPGSGGSNPSSGSGGDAPPPNKPSDEGKLFGIPIPGDVLGPISDAVSGIGGMIGGVLGGAGAQAPPDNPMADISVMMTELELQMLFKQMGTTKRDPSPNHVGFVAPDADGSTNYNTLVVRPEYRIAVQFVPEDMDLIFPETAATDTGKKSRMQAVWYYHHPLDYAEPAPNPADPNWQVAVNDCWAYLKKNEGKQPKGNADYDARVPLTDPEATERLKALLGTQIVAHDFRDRDKVGPLFLWGACAMFNNDTYSNYFLKAIQGSDTARHLMENKTIKANAGLNRVPVIARVQKRYAPDQAWKPADHVWVYFQFVPTKLKNDGQAAAAKLAQKTQQVLNAAAGPRQAAANALTAEQNAHNAYNLALATANANPTPANIRARDLARTAWSNAFNARLAAGRAAAPTSLAARVAQHLEYMNKVYVTDRQGVADTDPFKENVSNTRGGKRGNPIGGTDPTLNLVLLDDLAGFNKKPSGDKLTDFNKSRQTKENPKKERLEFDKPIAVTDPAIPNAVKAQTNADGETGIIFMPSRCGGDRFKLRVFVGPGTLDSDGKEIEKDPKVMYVAETCTMEVWRRARVSQMMQLSQGALTPIGTGPGSIIDHSYGKGYLKLIYDRPQMVEIGNARWRQAYAAARAKALNNAQSPSLNQYRTKIKFDIMLPADPATATDPSWIPMTSILNYNTAALPPGFKKILDPANTANDDLWINYGTDELQSFMLNAMLADFTKSGHLPGITKIRARRVMPLEYEELVLQSYLGGMSMQTHGCFTFLNDSDYNGHIWQKTSAIPTEAIAIHEIGHTWLLRHQYSDNGDTDGWELNTLHEHHLENIAKTGGPPPPGTGFTYTYNQPPDVNKVCNMSYHPQISGDFCGKCCLDLAGWNVQGVPEPA